MKAIWTKTAFLAALLFSTHTVSAQLTVANTETLVNSNTASTQQGPAVAMDTSGRYVVVWESELEDGSGYGVYAKIYNKDHSVRVSDFLVNTSQTTNDQRHPDVAITPDGTIAIVWQSNHLDAQRWISYIKFYDIDGVVVGSRKTLDNSSLNHQFPVVAASDDQFAVAFMTNLAGDHIYGIQGKYYDNTGTALVSEFVVDSTAEHLSHPTVALDSNGNAVYAWQHHNVLGGGVTNIRAVNIDNTGATTSSIYNITVGTSNNKIYPSIARASTGEFIVVYSKFNADGDHYGIYGSRFSNSGGLVGSEFRISNSSNGSQDHPQINCTRDGAYYSVTWTDESNDGDLQGVYARVFDFSLNYLNTEQLINTTTDDRQMLSDVALSSDTAEVVYVWQGGLRKASTTGLDTDEYGVYTAALEVADNEPPVAICQNITVYLDGTGNVSILPADVDGGSTDNIGITSMTLDDSSFTCTDVGSNVVTLTVYDDAGLSDNCVAVVTVVDSVSPTAVCQNLTVYLDGTGNATITAGDIDNGSTDNCGIASTSVSQSSFTCADAGANTVTLTVTDINGNSASCSATVTVQDTTAPTASCQDITVYLDGSGNASITSGDVDAGSTDNCSIAGLSVSPAVFTCADVGANSVTLTVTDANGNSDACTATVTVVDSVSPTAVCQDITVYLDATGNATITSGDLDAGSTDNCNIASYLISQSSFSCANVGANTVTLTVTDDAGNSASCTSTVTIVDSISPVASCQDITVYLDGAGNATITAGDIDNGSTDNCGIASTSVSQSSFTCADVGANTVTLTVTDINGNSDVCSATVTVQDTTAPTAVCQNLTVYLDGSGNASITSGDVDAGSSDNCSIAGLSVSPALFTCADVGANSVTLTVTDANGNSDACTATVTVVDSVSPTAVCQDITVYLDATGNATITSGDLDAGSTDNCNIASYLISQSSFSCANVGANTVTLTVTDDAGNSASCASTVTIVDSISPVASCQDITVYLDGAGNATITAGDIDNGSTDNCGIASTSVSQSSFTCADAGANTVTLTVTDINGNSASCSATVTVQDTTAPTASCQDITVYLDGSGNASITSADIDNGSTDNCGVASLSVSTASFTCADIGANTVTLTVTDVNGNSETCSATVTVADTTSPVTPVLADVSDECSVTLTAPTTTDNCGGTITGTTTDPLTYSGDGSYLVTWTFDDGNGNTTTATQNVLIDDITAPTTPTLADITEECSTTVTAPTTTDNCAGTVTGTTTDPLTYSSEGTYVITWTFDDGNGNSTTATQNVIIDDVTAPVVPTLSDVTAECTATVTAPTATDNCSGTITGTTTDPLTYSAEGTYVITWSFDDGNGNTSTTTQNVIIDDVTAPVTPTLADLTDECSVTASAPTTTDNCAGTVTGTTTDPTTYSTEGSYVITWTFDDGNGNTSTATQNVIIDDVTPPTASNVDTAYAECIGDVAVDVSLVNDAADNCGSPVVTYVGDVSSNGSCNDTIVRTYNVADGGGNSIDVTQIIIINDVTPPTASTPVTLNVVCLSDVPSTTGSESWVIDEADNCGTPTVTWISDVSTNGTGCNDTITRTFEVADDCGNAITLTQLIIVNDDIVPIADLATLEDEVGFCDVTPATPTATDNCSGSLNGVPDVSFPINTPGTTVVTWTFTDACGNSTTQTQNVIVEQIEIGTYFAPDGTTIVASNNDPGVTFQWIDCETNTILPGETGQNFAPTYSSDFAVIVTQEGCSDTSDCVTVSGVGLNNISNEAIVLFPNPSTGQFTIQYDGSLKLVEMYDVLGRLVLTESDVEDGFIDASILAPGKYMVRVKTETDQSMVQPIVIGQK